MSVYERVCSTTIWFDYTITSSLAKQKKQKQKKTYQYLVLDDFEHFGNSIWVNGAGRHTHRECGQKDRNLGVRRARDTLKHIE